MLVRLNCDISSMVGVAQALDEGLLKKFEITPYIRRPTGKRTDTTVTFEYIESLFDLPPYTIRKINFMVSYKGSYIGKTKKADIPTINEMIMMQAAEKLELISQLHTLTIVYDLDKATELNTVNDTYHSQDGFVGSLLKGCPTGINEFAMGVVNRYEERLTPDNLITMDGLRRDFVQYVKDRNGKFNPSETDLKGWLSKAGFTDKYLASAGRFTDNYSLASRYGLFTMDNQSFKEWFTQTATGSASRAVALNMLTMAEIEIGTAAYDLGFVATEGIAYELVTYLAALLIL